jgi:hypothetical protein
MKDMLLKTFAATLVIAALAPLAVQANIPGAAIIHVPHRVTLEDKILEPGEYYVRQLTVSGYDPRMLHFYTDGGQKWVASVRAIPAYRQTPAETNIVEFRETGAGDQQMIETIWIAGEYTGFSIPEPRR